MTKMSTYQVRRTIETVATAHATSTGVAHDETKAKVREAITDAGDSAFEGVAVESTEVYEFPSGPFDPYRMTVRATLTVSVSAPDESTAIEDGRNAIDELLNSADIDSWEYAGDTTLETAS